MSWRDVMKEPDARLGVKQHEATLDLAEKIATAMKDQGVKASALAQKLGKSRAWISKFLHGGGNTTVFTAVEIADALGCDVVFELVPRETQMAPGTVERNETTVSYAQFVGAPQGRVIPFTRPMNVRMEPVLADVG